MPTIKITASDGEEFFGPLPTDWASTPLAGYAAIAVAAAGTIAEQCVAVAQLLGMPAEPFLADASLLLPIRRAAPFLFDGSLPDASDPVPDFEHLGTRYVHVGDLRTVSAEQLEALLNFLQQHDGNALASAPALLAVLYCPAGKPQTGPVVAAATAAFATLPMSVAWSALAAFLRSSASAALRIRTASALESEILAIMATLEEVTTGTVSTTFSQRLRRGLTRRWAKSVRTLLSKS